jgi:Mce-associated membrane protein
VADKTREANMTAGETGETAGQTPASADETPEAPAGQTPATEESSAEISETTGETGPATGADAAGDAADADSSGDAARDAGAKPGRGRLAAVILGVVTVVLAAFGVWATLEAHSLRSTAAPPNLALTDGAATSAVNRQIGHAINTVFSYNYADTGATRRAAQDLLTGPAIHQYNTYFALVTKDAPAQKLVVTTRVTNSGVELLSGNRARVLVFANQQDTRAGTHQTSYAGALFAVTAVRQGSRWKIENIDTFNGSQ